YAVTSLDKPKLPLFKCILLPLLIAFGNINLIAPLRVGTFTFSLNACLAWVNGKLSDYMSAFKHI
ncbi:MAG: hypothetical protein ACJA0T_001581, partial [Colwellia sp.]